MEEVFIEGLCIVYLKIRTKVKNLDIDILVLVLFERINMVSELHCTDSTALHCLHVCCSYIMHNAAVYCRSPPHYMHI